VSDLHTEARGRLRKRLALMDGRYRDSWPKWTVIDNADVTLLLAALERAERALAGAKRFIPADQRPAFERAVAEEAGE
jgi:hypothetical protein